MPEERNFTCLEGAKQRHSEHSEHPASSLPVAETKADHLTKAIMVRQVYQEPVGSLVGKGGQDQLYGLVESLCFQLIGLSLSSIDRTARKVSSSRLAGLTMINAKFSWSELSRILRFQAQIIKTRFSRIRTFKYHNIFPGLKLQQKMLLLFVHPFSDSATAHFAC